MEQLERSAARTESIVDPMYSKGAYFEDTQRHSADAQFKADNFLKLFLRFAARRSMTLRSFADVGCGSGDIARLLAATLRQKGFDSIEFKAYDVSPHVAHIKHDGVEYINGDFCASDETVDVATLFDVFEHVPDTIEFIKSVAQRCKVLGLHIPLDYSLNVAVRDLFRSKLDDPGHLVFMDTVTALNLLALSGLRVVDYEYTFGFNVPSGRSSLRSKLAFPLRYLLARTSPWLLSKTLGGASLIVIAVTPRGLRDMNIAGNGK